MLHKQTETPLTDRRKEHKGSKQPNTRLLNESLNVGQEHWESVPRKNYLHTVFCSTFWHVFITRLTSPQVHCVSLTFVREVESRVIQDESEHITTQFTQTSYTVSHQLIHLNYTWSLCSTVPEVEGGSVYNDITGQGEGLCCEQHSQWEIQWSVDKTRGKVKIWIMPLMSLCPFWRWWRGLLCGSGLLNLLHCFALYTQHLRPFWKKDRSTLPVWFSAEGLYRLSEAYLCY